jgi:CheY-like chemotaxis protein
VISSPDKPLDVLLVEDDPADVLLVREAFEEGELRNRLFTAEDGVKAMEFLRQEGEHAGSPRPDLVLLDLNLPRKHGREVLAEMKDDPKLRSIPVIVLTTSDAHEDVVASYDAHANAYVQKPVDFDSFLDVVRQIDAFYLGIVKLPPQ